MSYSRSRVHIAGRGPFNTYMSVHHLRMPSRRWATIRREVLERDGWRCKSCGRAGRLEVDHVVPVAKGGEKFDPDNCQALCRRCHFRKTAGERKQRDTSPAARRWAALITELESSPESA